MTTSHTPNQNLSNQDLLSLVAEETTKERVLAERMNVIAALASRETDVLERVKLQQQRIMLDKMLEAFDV